MNMAPLVIDGTVDLGVRPMRFNAQFEPGSHTVVLGPNGAGKSTLLRTLAGHQALTTGVVSLGEPLDRPDTKVFVPPHLRSITLQQQTGALFDHMTALDNVAFALRAAGTPKALARAAASELLIRLDAAALAKARPAELSGGERAKVALARTLAAQPLVVLLDEPAAALDVAARAHMRHVVAQLDQTVVTVTHDPVEARLMGSNVVVLDDGHTVQQGALAEVAQKPATGWVAGLLGLNVVRGQAVDATVTTPSGATLRLAEPADGDVYVTFAANAVTLHQTRPGGSARNVFEAKVVSLSSEGDRVRVAFDAGFEAAAVVTAQSANELDLRPGQLMWTSIKATELSALPA